MSKGYTAAGCKNIRMRKSEFVAMAEFLNLSQGKGT